MRILVKRQQQSLKLSVLVGGFPDEYEDSVLSAVSSLRLRGYIILDDYQPNGNISINRERRKEILHIVNLDISSDKLEATGTKEDYYYNSTPLEKKAPSQIITRYPISQAVKTVGISSLLIFGFVLALGSSIPETSPDTGSVVYYPHIPYKKSDGSAYGANDHEYDANNPRSSYAPPPATPMALKDCNQKLSQQQT
ncbi:MAG: hypothetical protein M3115_03855 [Thermoproteota archaeon]|nr:hypothetical protein [Thermoproteota archaeon]